jgi:hypothetical protein
MRVDFLRISSSSLVVVVLVILAGTVSCRNRRSFEHYSTAFQVPLQGTPTRVPDSRMQISVLSIDNEKNVALFRIDHLDTGETIEESVATGAYFRSAFGSHGLRVNELGRGFASLQRFGAK